MAKAKPQRYRISCSWVLAPNAVLKNPACKKRFANSMGAESISADSEQTPAAEGVAPLPAAPSSTDHKRIRHCIEKVPNHLPHTFRLVIMMAVALII